MPLRSWSLRWQLVGAQMAVVVVGVVTLLAATELILRLVGAEGLQAILAAEGGGSAGAPPPEAASALLAVVRRTVRNALAIAATAATLVGLAVSVLLTNELLRPLKEIARSSRRIAGGHYGERVRAAGSLELVEMANNFNMMAETLDQIEAQRITLIGNVTHELRTPLTALGGYLEGLLDGVLDADPETISQMEAEVRRLGRLVNDLQTLSRVESGAVPLRIEPQDLVPLVRRVTTNLAPQAAAGALNLRLSLPPGRITVLADPDRAVQILMNLVGNAIRYTPEGGTIEVGARVLPASVEVTVWDDGIGIPADALPYIFERFYRVDRSRTRATGGSGIGLTIARHLAWAMGGDLVVESEGPDRGTLFRLTLPRVAGAA